MRRGSLPGTPPKRRWPVLLLLTLLACGIPTDDSSQLQVTLSQDELQLVVGERRQLTYAVSGLGNRSGAAVAFSSSDPSVVRVDRDGLLLGVGPGEAEVRASLMAFQSAGSDAVTVHVRSDVSFEAVSPQAVRFGDLITVVGSALDPGNLAALSVGGWPAKVHSFVPAELSQPQSRDTLRVWAPPGAAPDGFLVALHSSGGTANWPLSVAQYDRYEPNNETPAVIEGPTTLTNPQLSFDPGDRIDWYRLRGLDGSFTVEVKLGLPIELVLGTVALSSPRLDPGTSPEWSVSPDNWVRCNGLKARLDRAYFADVDATDQSLWIAVKDPTADELDLTVEMFTAPADPVAYSIEVHPGYVTPEPPDEYEPNNHCAQATEVSNGFSGTLTIDGPADAEWFRFTVPEVAHQLNVVARCRRCSNEHFLDISVFEDARVGRPDAPDELPRVANLWSGALEVPLSQRLPPGDYFLVLHNEFLRTLEEVELSVALIPQG